MDPLKAPALSFEQDLLSSILDQDAIPHILAMAHDNWNVDAVTAFAALQCYAQKRLLRAYRGTGPYTPVDLIGLSLDEVAEDFVLFVEPTAQTRVRLQETSRIPRSSR